MRLNLSTGNVVNLGMLLIYTFHSTFADQLFVAWIPLFLVEAKEMSPRDMGVYAMLPLLGGAVGGIVGGMLNDASCCRLTGNRRWSRSGVVAFTGKTPAAVLIVLSVLVADGRLVMVVLLACKFFGDWSLPTQWGADHRPGRPGVGHPVRPGQHGRRRSAAFLAGPVMGYIKQTHGWDGLFSAWPGST